jgi:hypothetical protein
MTLHFWAVIEFVNNLLGQFEMIAIHRGRLMAGEVGEGLVVIDDGPQLATLCGGQVR